MITPALNLGVVMLLLIILQINYFHAGKFFMLSADFSKLIFSMISFRNVISVPNNLEPDQARRNVRPDLGPNCLQRLSAEDTSSERV